MSAALTYARRYALFTLVGIAGEDDIDAPDLAPFQICIVSTIVRRPRSARTPGTGRAAVRAEPPITVAPARSVGVRDKLLSQIEGLTSTDLI